MKFRSSDRVLIWRTAERPDIGLEEEREITSSETPLSGRNNVAASHQKHVCMAGSRESGKVWKICV